MGLLYFGFGFWIGALAHGRGSQVLIPSRDREGAIVKVYVGRRSRIQAIPPMPNSLRAKILVLSDACSRGERQDLSGQALRETLEANNWHVVSSEVLPDDCERIRERLEGWLGQDDCDAIFTTGGTGLSPRDVTPEATRAVIEKEIPGLAELIRAEGVKKTRRAALSRGMVGIARGKVIVNLPGSPRGARESLEAILDLVPHAIDITQGRTQHS